MGCSDSSAVISVLVCIPTVPGRQTFLANCARSYEATLRATDLVTLSSFKINLSIVTDAKTAGEGWQRCVDQGLEWWPETTHIHFSNDDIVVHNRWLDPLVEACAQQVLPAMRIEPAGGHCVEEIFETHPPMPPDYFLVDVPRNKMAYFYADHPENQPTRDWQFIDHSNLPFCTVEQWRKIGPFPPIHYGTDRWFAEYGRRAGYKTVARLNSVAFNYNANIGRHRGGWEEQDFAAFDGVFALSAYSTGMLGLQEPHPWRETEYGLSLVKEWRALHESSDDLPNPPPRIMTPEGRLQMFQEWRARNG